MSKMKDFIEQNPFEKFALTPEEFWARVWAKDKGQDGEVEPSKSVNNYQESSNPTEYPYN